jgi:hypothetical protein
LIWATPGHYRWVLLPDFYLIELRNWEMPLKKIALFLLMITVWGKLFSQKQTADLGFFVGSATPLCDYSKMNLLQSVNFDFGGFYRYNYNSRFSLRFNALFGKVGSNGELNTDPKNFKKNVFDFDAIIEVNYLDFMLGVEKMKFSPYVYTGIGLSYYPGLNGSAIITPNIPIGVGAKYALSKFLAVGAEASLHKLMNDGLDNLDNPYQDAGLIKVSDIWHNNDWISYFGLTLTYKFYKGNKACPAYNTIN